jgi:hypothetical protein
MRKECIIKFLYKIVNTPDVIVYKSFKDSKINNVRGSLAIEVKTLLENLGFVYVWTDMSFRKQELLLKHYTVNITDDEYQCDLVCQHYHEIRNKCLHFYYCHWPTLLKFRMLLTTQQSNVLNKLAKYIFLATKLCSLENS